ncbi:MAG: IPT/TIG domain-containing protein [Dehalococcoidia bacterium]
MSRRFIAAVTLLAGVALVVASDSVQPLPMRAQSAPVVTSVSPDFGPAVGGTLVTITGSNFASTQQFTTDGGAAFTDAQCNSATSCTARTPAITVADGGSINVRTVAAGQVGAPQSNSFTIYGRPQLASLDPSEGSTTGGTVVYLHGGTYPNGSVYFGPAPEVRFGDALATGVNCTGTTGTVCSVHTPAAANPYENKEVEVTITTPGGTSAVNYFLYRVPAPTVTSLIPNQGPGGSVVMIAGTNFDTDPGETTVAFGSIEASNVTCASMTQCTATAPPGNGVVNVLVTVAGQTSANTPADDFSYTPESLPVVTNVSPDYGSGTGGTLVTITGTNFVNGLQFQTDGGLPFTDASCTSASTCTATTPAMGTLVGEVTTFRTVAVGQTAAAQSNTFTAYGRPVITGLDPTDGPAAGGTVVWISGSTFPGNATYPGPLPEVRFGSELATHVNCTRTDGTVCGVQTPGGTGTVPVTITTPGGTSDPTPLTYTYVPVPTITSISPDSGPRQGDTAVTINGTGFDTTPQTMTAMFGSAPALATSCSSATVCTAFSPPAGADLHVSVTIVNVLGYTSNGVPFSYAPIVTSVSPDYGPSSGGTTVTLHGTAFDTDQGFQLASGTPFADVRCSTSTTCTAVTPAVSVDTIHLKDLEIIAAGQTDPAQARFVFYGPPYAELAGCYKTKPLDCLIEPHTWIALYGGAFADGSSEAPGVTRVKIHHTYPAPDHVECHYRDGYCSVRVPNLGITFTQCAESTPQWGGYPVGITVETPGGSMYVFTAIYVCSLQPPETETPAPTSPWRPMQVNGTVTQGERTLLAGAIEARVGGSVCGAGAVFNGAFTLSVASSATIPGCGTDGATVVFRVNGAEAEGSVRFTAGGSATVELRIVGLPGALGFPGIPGLPTLPGIPGIPSLPTLPGIPGLPSLPIRVPPIPPIPVPVLPFISLIS